MRTCSNRTHSLTETVQESEAIRKALRSAPQDVFLGSRATRESVLESSASGLLKGRSVVLFATHGLALEDRVNGLTQPALAMAENPKSAALPLLGVDDILGLEMDADWLILSACNTAASDKLGGEALGGLARAFSIPVRALPW